MNYKTCILIKQACYFEFFVNKKNLLVDMLNIRNDCVWVFFKSMLFFSNHIPYLQLLDGVGGGGVGCKIILVFDQF